MTRVLVWLWTACLGASAGVLIMAGLHVVTARDAVRRAMRSLDSIASQALELAALRRASRDLPVKPESSLPSRVSNAIARAGLPSSALQSLSPETRGVKQPSPGAIPGDAIGAPVRLRASLTLANLTLPQFGAFLDAWRTAEPDWTIAAIELAPIPSREQSPAGADLPLRATVSLEGVFRDRPSGVSR